jgi:hypothetical protein
MFFLFCLSMRTLSHEKTCSGKNLNDSAGTRHKFSQKTFASQQCSYMAVFPQERFLEKKVFRKDFNGNFGPKVEFLLRSLLAGAMLPSSLFRTLRKRCFPRNDWKFFRKGSLAAKFPARVPCTKIQIHSFHDNLIFKQICD